MTVAREDVYREEREYLDAHRDYFNLTPLGSDQPTGLALSGGGIRSAVFCLGFIQAMAKTGLLPKFDYLSTVSGGGYIGAALTWWTSDKNAARRPYEASADNLPWGTQAPNEESSDEPPLLTALRQHGSYLTPGHGITLLSGVAIVLRGVFINLLVWGPLTTAALLLPIILGLAREDAVPFRSPIAPDPRLAALPDGYLGILLVAILAFAVFILSTIAYSLVTFLPRGEDQAKGAASALGSRYLWRGVFERGITPILWLTIVFAVWGSLPIIALGFGGYVAKAGGPIALTLGIVTGHLGDLFAIGSDEKKRGAKGITLEAIAPAAALLTLYGFLLIAWLPVEFLTRHAFWPEAWSDLRHLSWTWTGLSAPAAGTACWNAITIAVPAAILGCFVNLNYISAHRFYRDRLMEAFMPDFPADQANPSYKATRADSARLSAMCRVSARGPYHLLNTNVILTESKRHQPKRPLRGGDSFVLSPRYCGSDATGWIKTKDFMRDGMTVPTAMAISGAAINPGATADGIGVGRSVSVSMLLALLNIRLGYWVPNPGRAVQWIRPNHFYPGLWEFLNGGRSEASRMVQLSDGGHFENLGAYELLRRRAKVIVACDADQDENFDFADLKNLLSLAAADCDAEIRFPDGLDPLMPTVPLLYPSGVMCSNMAFLLGQVTYHQTSTLPEQDGILIYVKATLLKNLRLELLGYKGTDAAFPDDSTINQFFDEAKFEAYRELGYVIGEELATGAGWCSLTLRNALPREQASTGALS